MVEEEAVAVAAVEDHQVVVHPQVIEVEEEVQALVEEHHLIKERGVVTRKLIKVLIKSQAHHTPNLHLAKQPRLAVDQLHTLPLHQLGHIPKPTTLKFQTTERQMAYTFIIRNKKTVQSTKTSI